MGYCARLSTRAKTCQFLNNSSMMLLVIAAHYRCCWALISGKHHQGFPHSAFTTFGLHFGAHPLPECSIPLRRARATGAIS
jgi:hypothetical protein